MIDSGLIRKFKAEWSEIYSAKIDKQEYIFRALTYIEYYEITELNETASSAEVEDAVVAKGLLYPKTLDASKTKAGVITQLADEILEYSVFTSSQTARMFLDAKRAESQSVHSMMKAFVLAAIPTYQESTLDNMTFSQLAEKVALAEQIIRIIQAAHGIDPPTGVLMSIMDPEEIKEQQESIDPVAEKLQAAVRAHGLDRPKPGWEVEN